LKLAVWGRSSVKFHFDRAEMDVKRRAIACHVSQLDEGWDKLLSGEVEIGGLEFESYLRIRDTNPADLLLNRGVFPELI
jgi:hypothetical protein